MDSRARKALSYIRRCFEKDRVIILPHFRERMDRRGLVWPDITLVIEEPTDVRYGGLNHFARPKWIVAGESTDGLPIRIVCALESASSRARVVFITIYWE